MNQQTNQLVDFYPVTDRLFRYAIDKSPKFFHLHEVSHKRAHCNNDMASRVNLFIEAGKCEFPSQFRTCHSNFIARLFRKAHVQKPFLLNLLSYYTLP